MEAKVIKLEVQIQENNEIIDRLESKIVQLEAKVQQQDLLLSVLHPRNITDDDQQQEYSFYDINPSTNQSSSIYIGMPSSCKELKLIGHTLNGLYSVMGNQSVETVFCDFTNLIDDPGLEKWIGYNDVKSSPVYFYVQKNSSFFAYDTPILFEVERINVGNAMELPSGIFTAPQTGTYHFSFTGMASFPTSWTFVYLGVGLYVNGNRIGMGLVEETNTVIGQNSQLTLQSTLNLQVGDKVWVEIYYKSNSVFLYDASDYHYTHYTGWLM
ncbi:uncharacterized protein LOC124205362 isoform X2 [Daphnia pulex]|nr:uncharacterized protein LOC124205362 isoform X2 [Daphnia pulex]